jgi:hypothetical protein
MPASTAIAAKHVSLFAGSFIVRFLCAFFEAGLRERHPQPPRFYPNRHSSDNPALCTRGNKADSI